MVERFCAGFLLSLSLCLDLGIVNLAALRTALVQGGNAGFLLGAGSCVGDMLYFTLAMAGAAALTQTAAFRWALWIFGTGVLLYLAWRMVREVIRPRKLDLEGVAADGAAGWALFATGFGLAVASPTAILWFAAVGGSVIASYGGGRASIAVFAGGFFAAGLAWSAALAYGAAGLRRYLGVHLVRVLALISALLFLYFAAVVFISGSRQMLAL